MEQEGYIVLNGCQIDSVQGAVLEARFAKRFAELDAEGKGVVTGEQTRVVFREEAAGLLLLPRLEFPAERLDAAFQAQPEDELDREHFVGVVQASLVALSNDLKAKPVVTSLLDGSAIREVLADEDDFAVLAESLFTKLDVDENGKLSRNELQPALLQLGVELGVPTTADKPDAEALVDKLFQKHGAEGSQDLGQAQFANLLQDMLLDLADSLKANPVVVVHDGLDPTNFVKAPALEEIMADQEKLDEVTEGFFRALDVNQDGKLDKEEVKPLFMLDSHALPPLVAEEIAVNNINTVFPDGEAEVPGEISKSEFADFMEVVLEGYASNLKDSAEE